MPGIPINSLQDMLLLRELKNQQDPFRSGIQALAQGVASGIETQREEAALKKRNEEALATVLKGDSQDRTNSNVIKSFSIKDGKPSTTIRSATPNEQIALRKEKRELQEISAELASEKAFKADMQSGLSGKQLLSKYIDDPDRQEAILAQIKLNLIPLEKTQIGTPIKSSRAASVTEIIPKEAESVVTSTTTEHPITGEKTTIKNIEGLKKVKTAEEKVKLKGKITDEQRQMKEAFRSVEAGLNLTGMSYGDAVAAGKTVVDKITTPFGVKLDPSRGLEGKAFSWINKTIGDVGFNPLYNAFEKGMAIELAPELAKSTDKGLRLSRQIIAEFRKTIPTLENSTTAEGAEQLVLSGANAFRKYASKLRDDNDNFVYRSSEELNKAINDFQYGLRDVVYKNLIAVGAYEPEMQLLKGPNGRKYNIPDYKVPELRRALGGK